MVAVDAVVVSSIKVILQVFVHKDGVLGKKALRLMVQRLVKRSMHDLLKSTDVVKVIGDIIGRRVIIRWTIEADDFFSKTVQVGSRRSSQKSVYSIVYAH